MRWFFKRSPAPKLHRPVLGFSDEPTMCSCGLTWSDCQPQHKPLCSCCSDPSAGTVKGWAFCEFHLEQVRYRMRRESSR